MSPRQTETPARKSPSCPVCRERVTGPYRPFCSRRCADIDLGRWLNGSYAISGHADDDEDGIPGPATDYDPDD